MITSDELPCCVNPRLNYINYVHQRCALATIMDRNNGVSTLLCCLCDRVLTSECYTKIVSFLPDSMQSEYRDDFDENRKSLVSYLTPGNDLTVKVSETFLRRILTASNQ